jgi:hypothetical protein
MQIPQIRVPDSFAVIVTVLAETYGIPAPRRVLSLGDPEHGWGVQFNCTKEAVDSIPPYHAAVTWNGWPAGIIHAFGGGMVDGAEANESTFIEWINGLSKS